MPQAPQPSELRAWLRSLAAGLLWLFILFTIDAVDSYYLLMRSTRRIKTDQVTRDLLAQGVVDYVGRVSLTYLVMGFAAGAGLHLLSRLWHPLPQRPRAFWRTALLGAAATTLIGYARQMSSFPALFDSIIFTRPYAELVQPWMVDLFGIVFAAGVAFAAWRRWPPGLGLCFAGRLVTLLAFVGICAALLRNPAPRPLHDNKGPNLVLLGIDALRPDHLAFNGYDRDTAPHIDALLRESVVFDSAWTPLARTYPAWTATLSGTLPITNGIRDNLPEPEALVPPVALLPQVMRDAGWTTAFATDDSRFSYMVHEVGFEHILQPPVNPTNFAVSVNEPRFRAFHGLMHNPVGFGIVPTAAYNQSFGKSYRPWLFADRAQDLLAKVSEAERFLFAMHSCVLHAPGDRAWPWYRMHGQVGYKGSNRFHYSRSGTEILVEDDDGDGPVNLISEQDVRIYDSGIDMADRLVGQLMDALRASGQLDNTVIVLFSDHGEETWAPDLPYDYNGPNHGFHPYGDAQFNVLLSVRFPDGSHAGERVGDTVRLIDLAPTVAEHFGLDWPEATPFDGASVLPLVRGERETGPRPVYIETGLSEARYWNEGHKRYPFSKVSQRYRVDPETKRVHIRPEFRPQLIAAKDRVLQVGRWKLVWRAMTRGQHVELFDREADVFNRKDVSASEPLMTAQLGLLLSEYLRQDGIAPALEAHWRALVEQAAEDRAAAAETH